MRPDLRSPSPVVVIGAGIGGLAAALRLASAGHAVTVVERAGGPGGKMRTVPSAAGPVDAGPTVLTLRPVFEALFAAAGALLAAVVTVMLLVAAVRQARSSSRESGTRAAAYLHVPLAFVTVGGLVQPSSFWPTVAGAVVVVDGLIVWFAVNHHWRRARRDA